MANVKFPQATHDFYKSNGSVTVVINREPSLTRQEFAEEADINNLMKRYEGHGQSVNYLLNLPHQGGTYVDFAEMPQDLMGYMQFMDNARNAFMSLPAAVRKEFDNDPVMFVDYASDPRNLGQMQAWGLAEKPAAAPQAAPGAPPPAGTAQAAPSSSPPPAPPPAAQ